MAADKTNKAAKDGCRRNTGGSHTRLPAETGKGQPEWLPFLYGAEWVPFLGGHTVHFLEEGGEVVGGGEADLVGDFGDGHLLLGEEFGGLDEADVADVVARRLVGEFLELAVEVDTAEADFFGHLFACEGGVAEAFVDDFEDTLEQTLVGREEFGRVDLVGRVLCSAVGGAQATLLFEEVLDRLEEDFDVEGLRDKGVGTHFETCQTVLVAGLGSDEDDGEVVELNVATDAHAELYAVDFGHHIVGDDEREDIGLSQQDLEGFATVGTGSDAVASAEFLLEVGAHLIVVVDHEDAGTVCIVGLGSVGILAFVERVVEDGGGIDGCGQAGFCGVVGHGG